MITMIFLEIKQTLKVKEDVFERHDIEVLKVAKYDADKAIGPAEAKHRRRREQQSSENNA